jgi:hypothetical protein
LLSRQLIFTIFIILLSACGGVRHMGHGDLVRQISFEGNGGLSSGQDDYSLLSQMESGETGPRMMMWPF